jgi:hypothetical protein
MRAVGCRCSCRSSSVSAHSSRRFVDRRQRDVVVMFACPVPLAGANTSEKLEGTNQVDLLPGVGAR